MPSSNSMLPVNTRLKAEGSSNITGSYAANDPVSICPSPVDDRDIGTGKKQTADPLSSDLFPCTTTSPTPQPPGSSYSPSPTSAIPVLRHSRPLAEPNKTLPHRLPKSKSAHNNSTSRPTLLSIPTRPIQTANEASPKKAAIDSHAVVLSLNEDSKAAPVSSVLVHQQMPSVADLRQSFEKGSQPSKPAQTSDRLAPHSKPSYCSIRQNQDLTRTSSFRRHPNPFVGEISPPKATLGTHQSLVGRGEASRVGSKSKMIEQVSPTRSLGTSLTHGSTLSSPRSSQSSQRQVQHEEPTSLHRLAKCEYTSHLVDAEPPQGWVNTSSLKVSMDGSSITPLGKEQKYIPLGKAPELERTVKEDRYGPGSLQVRRDREILSPVRHPTQGTGKVSQLRRLFERSSRRFSLSFTHYRPRAGLHESVDNSTTDISSSSQDQLKDMVSTRTGTCRRIGAPSLTTEISVNDFSCDFSGGLDGEINLVVASPHEEPAEIEPYTEQESPVKNRIQHFERINRDSLHIRAIPNCHTSTNDGHLHSSSKSHRRRSKRKPIGGWQPIHQKGAAIWRKISSSLSRSLDSWKDCNSGHEQTSSVKCASPGASLDCSSAASISRGHHRRSSSFGYRLYRISHRSRQLRPSSYAASSLHLSGGESSEGLTKGTSGANHSRSSPDIPPPSLSACNSPPFIARMRSGFGLPGGLEFGLDGQHSSKPGQDAETTLSEATTAGPSTPQGDPNTLLKVMLKQSAAERDRRKQDEKHQRKAKTGMADLAPHSIGGSKKPDKGKGKEKEIAPREPREGGTRTNRKQDNDSSKKTESGFEVFEAKDVKLRHPKPRRPGQASSGMSFNSKASSGLSLKDNRPGFRQKASSALGFRGHKGNGGNAAG
ncbi:hypothetical protein F5Y19DRAFT_468725 [Xylariaceae sp. FL1651]|nr:hypothetical protein F5Y19DRAFT_468725 [Xylariaceae sp. FL1651]